MTTTPEARRWAILTLMAIAEFMIMVDLTIVNVALPSIQRVLGFSEADLPWVINAYTLLYGGFLLLGGRAADLLGRRAMLLAGLIIFSCSSLACGLAGEGGVLVAARAMQGFGAALFVPAALAIVTVTFPEGAERNRALGIWGAISGLGAVAGVILGGVIVQTLGWRWCFLVNVPVGLALIVAIPRAVRRDRAIGGIRGFDLPGACTGTAGLLLLVYAVVRAGSSGWGSANTLELFAGAAVLLAAFFAIEKRAAAPLLPLGLFRLRSIAVANLAAVAFQGPFFAQFFFVTLYLQQILGFSALKSGFGLLPIALCGVVSSIVSSGLVARLGARALAGGGIALCLAGLLLYARIGVDDGYAGAVLLPACLIGLGLGPAYIALTVAAVAGVGRGEAGLASGVLSAAQQVGGALGLAVLTVVASSRTGDLLRAAGGGDEALQGALVAGFQRGFEVGAGILAIGVLLVVLLMPGMRAEPQPGVLAQALQEMDGI